MPRDPNIENAVSSAEAQEMRATLVNYTSSNPLTALKEASYADDVCRAIGMSKADYDRALEAMGSGRFDDSREIRSFAAAVRNILEGNTSAAVLMEYETEARAFIANVGRTDAQDFVEQMDNLHRAGEAALTRGTRSRTY